MQLPEHILTSSHDRRGPAKATSFYYRFSLECPVLWNMKFREDFGKLLPLTGMVVNKTGEGMKYSQSGVFEIDATFTPPAYLIVQGLEFRIEQTSRQEFDQVRRSSMNKVFFKGFPFQAKKTDVKQVFDAFGLVKYIYFMCEPKKTKHPCKMGYVVFDSRDSVDRLFSQGNSVQYQNHSIACEEYLNTKKSRREFNSVQDRVQPKPSKLEKEEKECTHYVLRNGATFGKVPSSDTLVTYGVHGRTNSLFQRLNSPNDMVMTRIYWMESTKAVLKNTTSFDNIRFNVNLDLSSQT